MERTGPRVRRRRYSYCIMIFDKTYISQSSIHGYGVFVTEDIRSNEIIIEYPYVLVRSHRPIPPEIATHMFAAEIDAIAVFGSAAYINSSKSPNVRYEIDLQTNLIQIIAINNIPANTEITLNYM